MHEINKEKVREIFAVVTGRLEDASLLALEGQSQEIETQTAARLRRQLIAELTSICDLLHGIELCRPPKPQP